MLGSNPYGQTPYSAQPAAVGAGSQTLSNVGGIASAEAFGVAKVNLRVFDQSIASAEAFGAQQVNLRLAAAGGIQTAEDFGNAPGQASDEIDLVLAAPPGIATGESFGADQVNLRLNVAAVPSAEAFGAAAILATSVLSQAGGIPSGEAFGSPVIPQEEPRGFGYKGWDIYKKTRKLLEKPAPKLSVRLRGAGGIPSGETFGQARVTTVQRPPPTRRPFRQDRRRLLAIALLEETLV